MLFKLLPVTKIAKKDGHIFKSYVHSSAHFSPREIYINSVSGSHHAHWRSHKLANLSIQVISGRASFFLSTSPSNAAVSTINFDHSSTWRLLIFPNTWFSFKSTSSSELVLLCLSDILHDPCEIVTL